MSVDEMNQLLDVLKTTGATHIEVATVIGHPNFVSYSKQWADAIHAKGMFVTWRNAHINMEGLYGAQKFVGALRVDQKFWIDEAVSAFTSIKDSIKAGDEEAIYPERTEGIFQDATAFLWGGLPGSYAVFFGLLHDALKIFPWTVGLSANNASELMAGSRWMPQSLINYANVAVIDHYRDGNPTQYEIDIRDISNYYGKPVYVQEGAPDRFTKPSRLECDLYYTANKKLADEGILESFGSWSGWAGDPESIVDKTNGIYSLNDNGLSLQAWWGGGAALPLPPAPPPPQPVPPVPPQNTDSIVFGDEEPHTTLRKLTVNGTYFGKIKLYK